MNSPDEPTERQNPKLSFKMPQQGIPAAESKKIPLSTDDQPISAELQDVISEFKRVSAQSKAAQKTEESGIKAGQPAQRSVVHSIEEQAINPELDSLISQLIGTTEPGAEHAEETILCTGLPSEETHIEISAGQPATKTVPKSINEQAVSFQLASEISQLKNSIGYSSFQKEERLITPEVQIGTKKPTSSLSLKTQNNTERAPSPQIKNSIHLKGKEPPRAIERDNTDLLKGANIQQKSCDKCAQNIDASVEICTACGHDFNEAKPEEPSPRKKHIRQLFELIFWASAFAVACTIWLAPATCRELYNQTLAERIDPIYATYIKPYLTGEHDPLRQAELIEAIPVEPDPETQIIEISDMEKSQIEVRRIIDSDYPILEAGDVATFVTLNGKSAKASFVGIESGQVILERDGKQIEVPLDQLRLDLRLRVDPDHRTEYIENKASELGK